MAREVKHENGCLPSILLFTSEAIRFFPLSSCPKHAKSPKRLPSFPQFRKKIIPFLYRLLSHAHLWPWQAWSWLSLYTSARTRPVRGCWLRSISLVWGSMLPPPHHDLALEADGVPASFTVWQQAHPHPSAASLAPVRSASVMSGSGDNWSVLQAQKTPKAKWGEKNQITHHLLK